MTNLGPHSPLSLLFGATVLYHTFDLLSTLFLKKKFFLFFKNHFTILLIYDILVSSKREVRTMDEMMDLLMYLAENGYDFEDLTFDDFVEHASLEAVKEIAREFFDEDPTD